MSIFTEAIVESGTSRTLRSHRSLAISFVMSLSGEPNAPQPFLARSPRFPDFDLFPR